MKVSQIKRMINRNEITGCVVISRLFIDRVSHFEIKTSELMMKLSYIDDDTETTACLVGDQIWILGTP